MKFVFIALLALAPFLTHAQEFIPLTSVPAFREIATSDGIANFLNNMYKIAVGLAAVLAVLQIIRAGFEYMGGDSITEKRHARHLILMSLVGLLLVLSPAIVFGIIDPRILNLDLNVEDLQPKGIKSETAPASTSGVSGQTTSVAGTFNFFNVPAAPGNHVLILTNEDTSRSPACLMLAYRAYGDQATCEAARGPAVASHQGWTVAGDCVRTLTNYVPVQSQGPICSTKEELPAPAQ